MADKLTDIDKVVSNFKCANCGKKFGKTYGWLKTHDHLVCNCGFRNQWKPEQFADIVKSGTEFRAKAIKKLRRTLKR